MGIRLSHRHQLGASTLQKGGHVLQIFCLRSPFALWLGSSSVPNTQQSTLTFIHPASANRCLAVLRVMRVLESDPVGLGEIHPEQVTSPLQDTHVPTHTHTPTQRQFKVCNQPNVHVSNNEDSQQYLREGRKGCKKRHAILKYNQMILKVFV